MMLYFEDYASLRASLSPEDALAVLDAMAAYAEYGELPVQGSLSSAASICWNFVRPKIDRDTQAYQRKSDLRREAANKRWGANDANACNCINSMQDGQKMQMHVFMPTQPNSTQPKEEEEEERGCAPAPAPAPADPPAGLLSFDEIASRRADIERAEGIIRRYRLPDCEPTMDALLEDAERYGWERLEAALQTASLSNSRKGLSVNFYRSVIAGQGRSEPQNGRDPYAGYASI